MFSGDDDSEEWFEGVKLYKSSNNVTGYKGVTKKGNQYQVKIAGEYVGSVYDTAIEAAAAYSKLRNEKDAAVAATIAAAKAEAKAEKVKAKLEKAKAKKAILVLESAALEKKALAKKAELSAVDELIEKLGAVVVDDAE